MPTSFVAGPTPVKPAAIENLTVKWDVADDGVGSRWAKTYGGDAIASTQIDKNSRWVPGVFTRGASGAALRGVIVDVATKHSEGLAAMGTNAPDTKLVSDAYAMDPKRGTWMIAIDRKGSKSDQVLRGRLDDQLPQSIKDVLLAASNVMTTTKMSGHVSFG